MTLCQLFFPMINMIEWERARTAEQKESREKEILLAAKNLLEKKTYESIRFSDLAELVTFSRANIYKYFQSKEEVYLSLLADEILNFAIHAKDFLIPRSKERLEIIDEFCNTWTDLLTKEKNLLLLLSMTGTILEKNCSDEVLLQSKRSMHSALYDHLAPYFSNYFPKLTLDERIILINTLVIIANGLYSFCGLNENQKKLLKRSGMQGLVHEFSRDYKLLIKNHLQSLI